MSEAVDTIAIVLLWEAILQGGEAVVLIIVIQSPAEREGYIDTRSIDCVERFEM